MKSHQLEEPDAHILNGGIFKLTPREWNVLIEVANYLTNAEIAEKLDIVPKSAENYRARIGAKLNLKGPRKLTQFAHKHHGQLQQWYEYCKNKKKPSSNEKGF